jgi:hypothetical protein
LLLSSDVSQSPSSPIEGIICPCCIPEMSHPLVPTVETRMRSQAPSLLECRQVAVQACSQLRLKATCSFLHVK